MKGFQRGNPGRPQGSLNKETLSRLAARTRFEEKVSQKWDEVVDALLKQNPVYVADQIMGKSPEEHNVNLKKEPSERIKQLAAKLKDADK